MKSLAFDAMQFAREAHREQRRKYTGNPYVDHLAEVAGIAMSVGWRYIEIHPDEFMAVCWLHDCVEDQGVTINDLANKFGIVIAQGVHALSDLEVGNRAERKAASRARLTVAPGWVQTIKCADLISNTSSIVQHDPKFAETYLREKQELLAVMGNADRRLWEIAMCQASRATAQEPSSAAGKEDEK